MSKQKALSKKPTPKSKIGKYLRNLIFILVLVALAWVLFQRSQMEPMEDSSVSELSVIVDEAEQAVPDNQLVEDALEDDYSVGTEPPLLRFAPKEVDEIESFIESEEELKVDPYTEIIENEDGILEETKSIIQNNNLKEYRLYLESVNKLTNKFYLDEEYGFELQILKGQQLPARVEEVILLLESYNKSLISQVVSEDMQFSDSKLLAQFLTIKKIPAAKQEQKIFKEKIKGRLDILVDYIFSSELQNNFLKLEL